MTMTKTKYDKLFAVYEEYTRAIAGVNDPMAAMLCASWEATKLTYEQALASGGKTSQLAAGMEQGLRELPMALRAEGDAGALAERDLLYQLIDRFES